MAETPISATPRARALDYALIAALSHPLRHHILQELNGRVASPSDVAEALGAKVADVNYHIRKLLDLGLVELVRKEPRRGTLKHFYRATARALIDDEQLEHVPVSLRRTLFGGMIHEIWRDVSRSIEQGGWDRPDAHVSRTPLELDAEGHAEMIALLDEMIQRTLVIQAQARERGVTRETADVVLSELAVMHFLRGTPPPPEA